MDEVQKKLVKLVKDYPECIENKTMLRGFLADILNDCPLEDHLINDAYEIGIKDRLTEADDYYLCILSIQKQLESECGLTKQATLWTVASWSYMLGIPEAAHIAEKQLSTYKAEAKTPKRKESRTQNQTDSDPAQVAKHSGIPLEDVAEKEHRQQLIAEIKTKRKKLLIKCFIAFSLGFISCQYYPIALLVSIVSVLVLFFKLSKLDDEQNKAEGKIKFPKFSELKRLNAHSAAEKIKSIGFIDIDVDNKEDLKLGIFKKPGMLDTILINGKKCKNEWYDPDDHIVIVHHGFE